ncbi:lipase [Clavibacter michiganensis subsp. michiganensis]|uniref:alpha/beta hydrolase n=1 Tax=Clavibacter michiganensis TaxID=28447 RepID=UPI001365B8B6|nr:dienelactone hydrolase family protein [Clavibacter michiganensis]MWJ15885.1 lipase [Clavibacter michiganensis subsp. michiganensis]
MPAAPPSSRSRSAAVAALALVATLAVPTAAQAAAPVHHPVTRPAAARHQPAAAAAVDQIVVPATADARFGGGTIFAPRGAGQKVLGSVVVTPGFHGRKSDMAVYGTELAAEGFVVFTIDTRDRADLPDQRATEMLAAADYLTGRSAVKNEVSPDRVALLGYSMGGGGTLQAAQERPSIRAALTLMPYDYPPAGDPKAVHPAYPELTVPTLIITGQKDATAIPAKFGKPAYDSIPAGTPKQYLQLTGLGHAAGMGKPTATIRAAITAFLERYLDGDTAYSKDICPAPKVGGAISASTSSCPTS